MGTERATEVALLREAMADPFIELDESGITEHHAIARWYRLTHQKAPLWCFDRRAFQALRGDSPTSYPLGAFLTRITDDEGAALHRLRNVDRGRSLTELELHLFARRVGLAEGHAEGAWIVRDADGSVRTDASKAQLFLGLGDLDAGPYAGDSIAWDMGSRLLSLVEAREAAVNKTQRAEVEAGIDALIEEVGATIRGGRPLKGPSQPILEALYEQGQWLFQTCWEALPAEPSDEAAGILEAFGSSQAQWKLWAIRLALPMLSIQEVIVLLGKQSVAGHPRWAHTAPRRFTVYVLAHRLGVEPVTLAERLTPYSDARDFFRRTENRQNPIPS